MRIAALLLGVAMLTAGPAQASSVTRAHSATAQPIVWSQGPSKFSAALSQVPFASVSCTSTTFCMAGRYFQPSLPPFYYQEQSFNGTTWAAPKNPSAGAFVSCVSATFCASVDPAGGGTTWNGTSWTAGVTVDTHSLSAISCVTATFCMAVDTSGKAVEWNGSWALPPVANTNALYAVSCATVKFCVAVGAGGNAVKWNGTSWSAPAVIDSTANDVVSVSCPSASFCEAVDQEGYYMRWNGSTWSSAVRLDGMTTSQTGFVDPSVDCPSAQYCMLVTAYQPSSTQPLEEAYWTWNGSSWSGPHVLNRHLGPITTAFAPGLSCVSSTYCVLVGADYPANVTSVWNGTFWSLPLVLGETNGTGISFGTGNLFGGGIYISCPSSSFCASSDGYSVVAFEHNGVWSPARLVDGTSIYGIDGISCASSTFCVAVDGGGDAVVYDGGWGNPDKLFGSSTSLVPVQAVSCYSASFCVTFGNDGNERTWNGSKWLPAVLVDDAATPESVSCRSASFCMMVDNAGYESTWNGTAWSSPTHFVSGVSGPAAAPSSVSCAKGSFACVVTTFDQGYLFSWNGSGWSGPVTGPGNPSGGGDVGGGVSCASSKFCYLFQETYASGTASAVWNGSAIIPITSGQPLWQASCYAVGRCVGVGGLYNDFYVEISSPPLAVATSATLPGGTVGTAYSTTLTASGGNAPFSWKVSSGSLPAGLTLSSAGVVSGTPTTAGTSTFTAKVTDSSKPAQTATRSFSLTIS